MDRSRIARIAALMLSAGIVATLLAVPASADLPRCRNCIVRADIANNAVGSGEIVDNAIRARDIGSDAVGASELIGGAVRPGHLHASAKPAIGVEELFGSTTNNTSAAELASLTVTAPANGTLVVTVTGSLYFQTLSLPSAALQVGQIGLCDTSGSFAACGGTHQTVRYDDANIANAANTPLGFTLSRVVPVTEGDHTFYVNGFSDNNSTGFSIGESGTEPPGEGQTVAIVEFFPAELAITSTAGSDPVL